MPEIFKFKQVEILHGSGGLKVNTDAILCGTWANFSDSNYILDIGTGCGIIALIAAQKNNAAIHAIEIGKAAANDAAYNFKNSKWNKRLSLFQCALQEYTPKVTYSHIISNPPYFLQSFPSTDKTINIAKHSEKLHYNDIFLFAKYYLHKNGKITLIFPYRYKTKIFASALIQGFYPNKICLVSATENKNPFRILCEFSDTYASPLQTYLNIMTSKNSYSKEYINLTKDFYTFM